MIIGPNASGAIANRARIGPRRSQQIGQRLIRAIRHHPHAAWIIHDIPDQGEIIERITRAAFNGDCHDIGRIDEANRIAIRPGARQFGKANFPARAGAIQHNNGLAQIRFHEARNGARGDIGSTASGKGDDHGNLPIRPPAALRARNGGCGKGAGDQRATR